MNNHTLKFALTYALSNGVKRVEISQYPNFFRDCVQGMENGLFRTYEEAINRFKALIK